MNRYQALLDKVKKTVDPLRRNLFFLAILTDALGDASGVPILVGGLALEFYTTGGYSTGDIDLIYADREGMGRQLAEWGFRKEGRHWISEEFDLFVEIPGSSIPDEERNKITTVEIESLKAYLIGIEDLLIDRLNAFVHWRSTDDGYWAKELLFIHSGRMDLEYLRKRCVRERTVEALEKLMAEIKEMGDETP
jgi:hypothetical protein